MWNYTGTAPDQSYLTDQETTDHEQDVKWKSMSDSRTERKAEIFTPPKIGGGDAYDSHSKKMTRQH